MLFPDEFQMNLQNETHVNYRRIPEAQAPEEISRDAPEECFQRNHKRITEGDAEKITGGILKENI